MNLTVQLRRWPNLLLHKYLHERSRQIGDVSVDEFEHLFRNRDEDVIYVHVGLGDVNAALAGDPYERVLSVLEEQFDSILAPGFTDYFRESGVYVKSHSRPLYGAFNRLFLDDADYRTDDACKSILVRGDYRFDECDHRDTYSRRGCHAQLSQDDVLLASIGTPWLMCSFLHYIEAQHDVPYLSEDSYDGVMITENDVIPIQQKCHYWDGFWRFNKLKLQRAWERDGIVDSYDLGGLRVFFASFAEIERHMGDKLETNPYYLVT